MTKLVLKKNPTLLDLQNYVHLMTQKRGFGDETVPEIFMLLQEECGELAKAARKLTGIHTDKLSKIHAINEEAADVLIVLLDICNHFKIDLEKSFREKEKNNETRSWTK